MKGLPWLTGAQIGFGRLAARYRPLGVLNSSTAQQPRRPGRPWSGPRATARGRQKFKGCTEQGAPLARGAETRRQGLRNDFRPGRGVRAYVVFAGELTRRFRS
jgi:hypothetical protein